MQRAVLKKGGKRLLQILFPLVILGVFLYTVKGDWNKLTAYRFEWNFWLLSLAFLGFLGQELSYGLIWRAVLARLGAQLGFRESLRIYLASEFVRYLPGNVWHVLTRIIWVGKYGVSRPIAFASMTVELITKLAAGVVVFALSLLFWGSAGNVGKLVQGSPLLGVLGGIAILALSVGLHPRVLSSTLNSALRLLKRKPVVLSIRYRDILLVTLAWCISWCIAGTAFYLMVVALWPQAPLIAWPLCVGIYAIAWDVGFVSFITPSGLGFREGAIVALFALSFPLPVGLAAILAILSRFVSTLAELVCVSLAYLSGGRILQQVRGEQASPPSLPDESGEGGRVEMSLSEVPSSKEI